MEFKTISKAEAKQFFSRSDLESFMHKKIVSPYFSLTNEYLLRGVSPRLLLKSISAMKSIEQMMHNPLGLSEYVPTKDCIYLIEKDGCGKPIENWENLSDTELKSLANEQFKELCKHSEIVSFSDNEEENLRLILEKMYELYTYCRWCLDSRKDFWGKEIALSDNEVKTFFNIEKPLEEALNTSQREILNLRETIECKNIELKKTKEKIAEYENEEDREPIPLFRELRDEGYIREIQDSEKTYGLVAYKIEKKNGIGNVLDKYKTYSYSDIQRTQKLIAPKTGKPYTLSNLKKALSGY